MNALSELGWVVDWNDIYGSPKSRCYWWLVLGIEYMEGKAGN